MKRKQNLSKFEGYNGSSALDRTWNIECMNASIRKERSEINSRSFHLRKLGKEQQHKQKAIKE
jgi:hypothetical protein